LLFGLFLHRFALSINAGLSNLLVDAFLLPNQQHQSTAGMSTEGMEAELTISNYLKIGWLRKNQVICEYYFCCIHICFFI